MSQEYKNCRQGNILTKESAIALGLIESLSFDKYCVLISHDCDIYSPAETRIEFIIATKPSIPNAAFSHTAHPRKLNITYTVVNCDPIILELAHADRKDIPQTQFLQEARIASDFHLSAHEKRILKIWLAARYGRPAFPNEFENRLKNRKILKRKSVKFFNQYKPILSVYFFF